MNIQAKQLIHELLESHTSLVQEMPDRDEFLLRIGEFFPELVGLLQSIYQEHEALEKECGSLFLILANAFSSRTAELHERDRLRQHNPTWHRSEQIVGMACYVDLLAGDLQGLKEKIPYFTELGITYLHLMPLYLSPAGDNDGGYAVSDYRTVDPRLGTMAQLRELAVELHHAGINLVLDFVFNHTSNEHRWAVAALEGDSEARAYYYIFDDREVPDRYERTLREIFPQVRRGSFTHIPTIDKWVWTTFNSFQWDLNYSNPAVFSAIVDEMLFLANAGVDVLRLDALAFIWKDMGTDCENRPNAHRLIQAFNRCMQIVAPGVVFKSEAIVHPDEVVKYIAPEKCQTSYNPLLMALIWNSLATRKTRLLTQSLSKRFDIGQECSWVNYARCHDDIGWTFDDADAADLGINGYDHRQFLNQFYTGQFDGSFATGVGFQFNPENGDLRVCGSLASLSGLEAAKNADDPLRLTMAVRRILLIHSIIMSIGGIPLLYAGDELGVLNQYDYQNDPSRAHDARWVNRPLYTPDMMKLARQIGSPESLIFEGIKQQIATRQRLPVLGNSATHIIQTGNQHLFAYLREDRHQLFLAVVNFSDQPQCFRVREYLDAPNLVDPITGQAMSLDDTGSVVLPACSFAWMMPAEPAGQS